MKKLHGISRRSLILAAPAVIIGGRAKAQIVPPCGPGGFCLPPSACRAPFYRDFSKMQYGTVIINPDSTGTPGMVVANNLEVRRENNIAGVTYGFTETDDNLGIPSSETMITWTSTNDIDGPWTYAGVAIARSPGSWDDHNIICASVINVPTTVGLGGPWCMYYSAEDSSGNWATGVAFSPTMQSGSWTKYSGNPVLSGGGQADPCVNILGLNSYIMYYSPNYAGGNTVEYALSTDGLNWSFGGVALDIPVMGDWDYTTHYFFEPFVFKNKYCFYEMLYDTEDAHNSLGYGGLGGGVGYAISSSPFGPFIRAPAPLPIIVNGLEGNSRMIEKNGLLYFFSDMFTQIPGNFLQGGVGLAFLPDPP